MRAVNLELSANLAVIGLMGLDSHSATPSRRVAGSSRTLKMPSLIYAHKEVRSGDHLSRDRTASTSFTGLHVRDLRRAPSRPRLEQISNLLNQYRRMNLVLSSQAMRLS